MFPLSVSPSHLNILACALYFLTRPLPPFFSYIFFFAFPGIYQCEKGEPYTRSTYMEEGKNHIHSPPSIGLLSLSLSLSPFYLFLITVPLLLALFFVGLGFSKKNQTFIKEVQIVFVRNQVQSVFQCFIFMQKIFGETILSFCMAQSLSSHAAFSSSSSSFSSPKGAIPPAYRQPWLWDGIAKEAGQEGAKDSHTHSLVHTYALLFYSTGITTISF